MADNPLKVFVEVPKGSRNKYEYDEDDGCIVLDRRLFSAVSYPTDYRFIPETRTVSIDGWGDSEEARRLVDETRERYRRG